MLKITNLISKSLAAYVNSTAAMMEEMRTASLPLGQALVEGTKEITGAIACVREQANEFKNSKDIRAAEARMNGVFETMPEGSKEVGKEVKEAMKDLSKEIDMISEAFGGKKSNKRTKKAKSNGKCSGCGNPLGDSYVTSDRGSDKEATSCASCQAKYWDKQAKQAKKEVAPEVA